MNSATPLLVYKEVTSALLSHREITDIERKYLATYRASNNISQKEHIKILSELGITEEEFLRGKES